MSTLPSACPALACRKTADMLWPNPPLAHIMASRMALARCVRAFAHSCPSVDGTPTRPHLRTPSQARRYAPAPRAAAVAPPPPETDEMARKASLIAPDRAAALAALRAEMKAAGDLSAFIVPSEDPHMSEYPPDCCARRMYISGFTGSAGTVVVTGDAALLWTDGRYYLQGEQELAEGWTLMRGGSPGVPTPSEWLAATLPAGAKVGVDAFVHTMGAARELQTLLGAKEQQLVSVHNLVDKCAAPAHLCPCALHDHPRKRLTAAAPPAGSGPTGPAGRNSPRACTSSSTPASRSLTSSWSCARSCQRSPAAPSC